jgi:organic hydroperoxide reductase OsmC/OhrA
VARFAPLYDVEIFDAQADVRATFFNTQKYGVDDAPAHFEEVSVKLSIDSPAESRAVAALVDHAERACHAAQSLRHPVPVTLDATLNGAPLARTPAADDR